MTCCTVDNRDLGLQVFDLREKFPVDSPHHVRHFAGNPLLRLFVLFPFPWYVTMRAAYAKGPAEPEFHDVEEPAGGCPIHEGDILENLRRGLLLFAGNLFSEDFEKPFFLRINTVRRRRLGKRPHTECE